MGPPNGPPQWAPPMGPPMGYPRGGGIKENLGKPRKTMENQEKVVISPQKTLVQRPPPLCVHEANPLRGASILEVSLQETFTS